MENEVNWADELGISVPRLWMEHPGHPTQLKAKKMMMHHAELYWGEKYLESLWGNQEDDSDGR